MKNSTKIFHAMAITVLAWLPWVTMDAAVAPTYHFASTSVNTVRPVSGQAARAPQEYRQAVSRPTSGAVYSASNFGQPAKMTVIGGGGGGMVSTGSGSGSGSRGIIYGGASSVSLPALSASRRNSADWAAAAASAEESSTAGPRRIGPATPDDDPTPVGDGLWALPLLAGAYAVARRMRLTRAEERK